MQTQAAANLETTRPRAGRFGWMRLMVVAALMILAAPVAPIVADGFSPFFLILILPPLIGLILLRFTPKVGAVWLGVTSFALLVMNAGFIPDALRHPESPADFVPVTMLTVGGLLAVAAAIPAFRAARGSGSASAAPRVLAGAAVALVLLAIGASVAARGAMTNDAPAVGSTVVELENFAFGPETINATAGEVSLYVTNSDGARHTFTIDELGVDVSIAPGQSRQIQFQAEAGEYRIYCRPHDPGMEGDLVVR